MLCAKGKCAIEVTVLSHFSGTPLGIKRFVKPIEIKANAEGLLNWLQFFFIYSSESRECKRFKT